MVIVGPARKLGYSDVPKLWWPKIHLLYLSSPKCTQICRRGPEVLPQMWKAPLPHPLAVHTFTVVSLWLTALMLCKAQLFLHWWAPLLQEKDRFSPYRDGIQLSLNYRGLNGYNSIFATKQVQGYIVYTFVSPFLVCGFYPHGCKKGCLYVQIMSTVQAGTGR